LLFEQIESGFAALGLDADEAESFAHGHAELADALLIVNDQEADAKLFVAQRGFGRI
jgi:hypothetical protein